MTSDYNGMIWMGTSYGVSCYDPKTGSFKTQGWLSQLYGIMCFSICELRDGNIAIGTDQGLYLYDRKRGETVPFPNSEQLNNKIINYIVQSNDGDVWCSTSNGIWQYSAERQLFIGHLSGNGLEKKEYLHGVGVHSDGDIICFGHNDGLVTFSPKQVQENVAVSDELVLTSFMVGDVLVNSTTVLNDVKVTDKPVAESDVFTLSHLDHTVTMGFSQFEFHNPFNVAFEYRLNKGEWVKNSEGKNEITFNFKIYVDIPENIKKERFFVRANERGLGDSAEHIYANANKKAEFYIRPCKKSADIVLSGAADRIEYKNFLNKIIGIVQELYFS